MFYALHGHYNIIIPLGATYARPILYYSETPDSGPSEKGTLYYVNLSTVDNSWNPKIPFPYSSNTI